VSLHTETNERSLLFLGKRWCDAHGVFRKFYMINPVLSVYILGKCNVRLHTLSECNLGILKSDKSRLKTDSKNGQLQTEK